MPPHLISVTGSNSGEESCLTMGTARDTIGVAHVSDRNPLWLCKNAANTEHECLYARCNDCQTAISASTDGRGTKRKRRNNNDTSNCVNSCDHTVSGLTIFCDPQYFSTSHMEGVIKNGVSFPTKCLSCKKRLSNRVAV
jgi:hypothetical protein